MDRAHQNVCTHLIHDPKEGVMSRHEELSPHLLDEMVATCGCLNLRMVTRTVTKVFDEALRPAGVRATQLPILVTLALQGPTTITKLSYGLALDRTSVTRLLKPLQSRALIRIVEGPDHRTRLASLTVQGERTVAQAYALWKVAQERFLDEFGKERWRHIRTALASVASGMRLSG